MMTAQNITARTAGGGATSPRCTIEIDSSTSNVTVLRVDGDLDISGRTELVTALDSVLRPDTDIVVDLSEVSFMHSGAAGVLIDASEAARSLGIYSPSRPVQMILEALGASDLLVDRVPAR